MQALRHIEEDVAGDDRQTRASALGCEWQLTVDANTAAVDRAPELCQRKTVIGQAKVAGPAGEEDALRRYQPGRVAERRLRADLPGARVPAELDVSCEPAGRAARHQRADDAELGVHIQAGITLDTLHESDAAAAGDLRARAPPVEASRWRARLPTTEDV